MQRQTRRRTASDREERGERTMEEGREKDKRDGMTRKWGRSEEKLQSTLGHGERWVDLSRWQVTYKTTVNSS